MADNFDSKNDLSALRIDRNYDREPVGSKKLMRVILWIGIPIIIIFIIWMIFASISPTVEVKTATATILTQTQAQSVLSATGYVVAQHQAAVASKATGRLDYLNVEEGDKVIKGQVIGQLENDDIAAALDQAKAGLEQARANSTQTSLNYNRAKSLLAAGSSTQADFENAEAAYMSNSAAVKSAEANVKSAQVALENTYIRAPFDGTVLTKYADVGEIVAPFGSSGNIRGAVVDLADMSSLEVEADVSESNIERVTVGQPCEIILDAYPEIRYKGAVKKIVPTADRTRATVMTKVTFDKLDGRVLPEMSAKVLFLSDKPKDEVRDEKSALIVPMTSVARRDGRDVVYLVKEEKTVEIPVTTGRKFNEYLEITSGISDGDKVIDKITDQIKNGIKVKVL